MNVYILFLICSGLMLITVGDTVSKVVKNNQIKMNESSRSCVYFQRWLSLRKCLKVPAASEAGGPDVAVWHSWIPHSRQTSGSHHVPHGAFGNFEV